MKNVKLEILKNIYDECYIVYNESISINILIKKNITSYAYLYKLLNFLEENKFIERHHEKRSNYINLTRKGKESAEAYIFLTTHGL